MSTILRPYQLDAVTQIRHHCAAGGKGSILQMSTGGGKTAIFCDLLMGAHKKKKRALMAVRGKKLVAQASERLTREGVPHGIYQGDNTADTHENILLCSIDTLFIRRIAPPADLVVLDECHASTSPAYLWFLEQYPNAYKLGVSATPHHPRGMRHIGDKLIRPVGIKDLINDGYLVGARYFVPYVPDVSGVTKANGDFNAKELGAKSVADKELTANAAKVWAENLRGLSTLLFAASVQHAGVLSEALSAAGARTATITATTPDKDRSAILDGLIQGSLDVVCSVGVLTTGVDVPSLKAILCCRPTESYNLWVQILGRGTRPYPGKPHFLVYDLSGNLLKHGPIEAEMLASLDGQAEVPKTALTLCGSCYATYPSVEIGKDRICPSCGAKITSRDRTSGGARIHGLADNHEVVERVIEAWETALPDLIAAAKDKGFKKGWIYNVIKGKFGEDVAAKAWPRIRSMKRWDIKRAG